MNEFEKQLKAQFPEIADLYELTKDESLGGGGESSFWELLAVLVQLNKTKVSGTLWINYAHGKMENMSIKTEFPLKKKL